MASSYPLYDCQAEVTQPRTSGPGGKQLCTAASSDLRVATGSLCPLAHRRQDAAGAISIPWWIALLALYRHQSRKFMNSLPKATQFSPRSVRIAMPGVLLLAACASTAPIPSASLYAAQQAILVAEHEGARTYAPAEIWEARSKLSSAQRAVDEKDMLAARRFADESRSDAELASARTSAAKAAAMATKAAGAEDAATAVQSGSAVTAHVPVSIQETRVAEERRLTGDARVEATPLDLGRREAMPAGRDTIPAHASVLPLIRIPFGDGGSELEPQVTGSLDRVSDFLVENPSRTAILKGFTDNRGSEDYNRALSQRRADSVKRYLVGRGVPAEHLSSAGRGENAPVADNDSAAGRKQNRRVEITLNQASGAQ